MWIRDSGQAALRVSVYQQDFLALHRQPNAEGIDLIPANIELAGLEVSLVNCKNRAKMLKQVLEGAKHEYDFIPVSYTHLD